MWAVPSLPCPRRKDGEDARTFLGSERNLRPALAAQRGHRCCPANGGPDGRPLLRQHPCSGSRILSGSLRDPYQRGPQCAVPRLLRAGPQEGGARPAGYHEAMVWLAPLLSVAISVLFWPQLQDAVAQQPDIELVPLLLANGLILWEPFFVYGWLQLRFERAFGVIPGIGLAAVCFGAYHLGTFPLSGVGSLALLGVFFGVLFRVSGGNLLALWPLTWAVTSSIGVLEGGFGFSWSDVATYALLLIVQVVAIALMVRHD